MKKLFPLVGFAVLLCIAGGLLWWNYPRSGERDATDTSTYTHAGGMFSVTYPAHYRVEEGYVYQGLGPEQEIRGVRFVIPRDKAIGTNLSDYDTGVSIEVLSNPRCDASLFLIDAQDIHRKVENGVEYSVASMAGVGAGNIYEETVYALPDSDPCIAIRYLIHSTNIGNYEIGAVRAFDKQQLQREFDSIRASLAIQ